MEMGLLIAQVSREHSIKLTPEIVSRIEDIMVKEFSTNSPTKLSTQFVPIILAGLEPKMDTV